MRAKQLIELGHLTVISDRESAVHTIRLVGELDLATADAVQDDLVRVEAGDVTSIVLNLSRPDVHRLDRHPAALRRRHPLALGLRPPHRGGTAVKRALQLAGLENHLPFAD